VSGVADIVPPPRRRRRRKAAIPVAALATAAEAIALKRHGYGFAGNVVVRCRDGHVFTTIWIPGVSVKSLRLGWWRVQWCPVGRHWTLVSPVDRSELSRRQRRAAGAKHDIRVP
jgi:hypothetical protein